MRNKLIKIILAASIVIAWALTFSCSDDKESWLSCKEIVNLYSECGGENSPGFEKCMINKGACNGASADKCDEDCVVECYTHYIDEGCFDNF